MRRANRGKWKKARDEMERKAVEKVQQKAANAAAENAATAERIRQKLLRRIEKEVDTLPEHMGTEMYNNVENMTYDGRKLTKKTYGGKSYRIRDLTAAYRDLTAGMTDDVNQGSGAVQVIIDV